MSDDLAAFARRTFESARELAEANVEDADLHGTLATVGEACAACLQAGGRLITFGNGGSMCDATHMAEELTGRYRAERPALTALALNCPGHLTCTANDYGFEEVFARGVRAHARAGDVVVGFTTSGNSPNVLRAFEAAREIEAVTVGFLGKGGGKARALCDHALVVGGSTADRIQEQHIQMVHMLIEMIELQLFPGLYD